MMKSEFELLTEDCNPASADIDQKSMRGILEIMNAEDAKVALAVREEVDSIARLGDLVVSRLSGEGRLFYVGAGTSGRIGVLDAVECPPTFGLNPSKVQGLLAGGYAACYSAVEASEDNAGLGERDVRAAGVTADDVVIAIAASGRTPYAVGALRHAKAVGAATGAVVCTRNSALSEIADVTVAVIVGPEVITGSTRLKAGTAQKMVLNMITTGACVRLGFVFGNLMVNVHLKNEKLIERGKRVLMSAAGVTYAEAERAVENSGRDLRVALLMLMRQTSAAVARELLADAAGNLRRALDNCSGNAAT